MQRHENAPALDCRRVRRLLRDYPPVLEDILLNGTVLTKIVRDGLPPWATAALEFTVTGSGAIRN